MKLPSKGDATAALFAAVALGVAVATSLGILERAPLAMLIADGATLLYYNSPAAIHASNKVYIGYIKDNGVVEIAAVDAASRAIERIFIHDYVTPDDHAAPALALADSGLLVATAFHSSSMFMYQIGHTGDRVLRCAWLGQFSYPRFDRVDDELTLYARQEDGAGGSLVKVAINDDNCSTFQTVAQASPGIWIYASPPSRGQLVWSEYEQTKDVHSGAFLNGTSMNFEVSHLQETLTWSTAKDLVALTHFEGAFECCFTGTMVTELYKNEHLIYRSEPLRPPYYPGGIVLDQTGREGLFPEDRYTFERRSLSLQFRLATCSQGSAINARPQYIENGRGYVWTEFEMPYSGTHLENARIMLCLY